MSVYAGRRLRVGGIRRDSRAVWPRRALRRPRARDPISSWWVLNGAITVSIDRAQVLTDAVFLQRTVLVGFTGDGGSLTDPHDVSDVSITTDAGTLPGNTLPESSLPLGLPAAAASLLVGPRPESPER